MTIRHRCFILFFVLLTVTQIAAGQNRMRLIDSLETRLTHQQPDTHKVYTYYKLIQLWCDSDAQKALQHAHSMVKLSDSLQYKRGKARALNGYGNLYLNQGNYQQSLFSFLQSLRIYEAIQDTLSMAAIYNGLGNIYSRLLKHEMSLYYYKQSIFCYIRAGDHTNMGQPYVNMGEAYLELKQYQKAISCYRKSLSIANNEYALCIAWVNIANALFEFNKQDSSKYYLNKALKAGCNPHIISSAESLLGRIYMHQHQPDLALSHFIQSSKIAQKAGIDYMLPKIYKHLSEAYQAKGMTNEALHYYVLFHNTNEQLQGSDKIRKITELQSAYELEKKDRQIESLDNAKKLAELQSGKDRLYRNSFIVAFVLTFLTSLAFVRNAYLKQKVNRILNENNAALNDKNKQIEQQKNEIEKINAALNLFNKEVLKDNVIAKYEILKSKTNPHFLFNSLTSLSAIVIRDKNSALEFIERFSELYRMILEMTDNRLISLQQEMDLVENYLYLEKARFRDNLIVKIDIEEQLYSLQLPSFAIQICVENALKHNTISDAQKLTVSIFSKNEHIIIRNNLQQKFTKIISTSTGQLNITERYRLLTDKSVEFIKTENEYLVKLPLLSKEHTL